MSLKKLVLTLLFAAVPFGSINSQTVSASKADRDQVAISRLDCGRVQVNKGLMFSDSYDYDGQTFRLVESCYLVRHGNKYLLWDTGFPITDLGKKLVKGPPLSHALDITIEEQLALGNIKPSDINYIGISHYHPDHSGQAQFFPKATLLMGQQDWQSVSSANPPRISSPEDFAHWISGDGKVEPVARNHDVFGDGSVMILATPGHTRGHRSLLVRLSSGRHIILTGDAAHRRENYTERRVPTFNADRADTLASLDLLQKMETALNAVVVVQHEPADVPKLAAFPEWSE
ncbi:N-acyl homoserine lactonase family protein [Parasphingorhabdus cellanae]|uniref:N-acyl homoserine lactonase family protein n=1 Tax=Parasphingorhabdus cellanae TaxID=2806553 RepID=A0ABX7T2P9_9SPHN|nr:N-acyl homoserine lactonase family protein [Parasphingorhabdus cellanae]QTD55836.1 N-acyl homoserine lactonase family protein [Parasphingorhabdus cellanae]